MPQDYSFHSDWVYPSSHSQSPTSSTQSFVLSPNYPHPSMNNGTISNYLQGPVMNMAEDSPVAAKRIRFKMIGPQRQNASEREKLRMRKLSKALHNLRKYLPPSVVPEGRNLTKIETLRLTISYISHLSQLLGLDEETMSQKSKSQPEPNECSTIPEGYQEATCYYYQQNQQEAQSTMRNEIPYQCNNFRISSTQYNTRQQPWESSRVRPWRNTAATGHVLQSPYTSRFTHTLPQVTDGQATNLHPSHLPYLRENDSCLRSNDPHFNFINSLQAS